MHAEEQRPGQQAVISAAGPILSLALGAIGLAVSHQLTHGTLPQLLALAVGFSNLLVGVFNLLPGLPLDGGQLLRAVAVEGHRAAATRHGRRRVGRPGAGGARRGPPVLLAPRRGGRSVDTSPGRGRWFIAFFVWTGASASLQSAQVRQRAARAHGPGPRPPGHPGAATCPWPRPYAGSPRPAPGPRWSSTSTTAPSAIVSEAAVSATPPERRPGSPRGVSRRLDPAWSWRGTCRARTSSTRWRGNPATEYLVVDGEGKPYGVLSSADVERAFAAT